MSNKTHYHAIRTEKGFQLLRTSNEAVYVTGSYLREEGMMRLFDHFTYEATQLVKKVDEFGREITKRFTAPDKKVYDLPTYNATPRAVNTNFTFDLQGEYIDWFLANYVDNGEDAKAWMTEEFPTGNEVEGMPVTENINEQQMELV